MGGNRVIIDVETKSLGEGRAKGPSLGEEGGPHLGDAFQASSSHRREAPGGRRPLSPNFLLYYRWGACMVGQLPRGEARLLCPHPRLQEWSSVQAVLTSELIFLCFFLCPSISSTSP